MITGDSPKPPDTLVALCQRRAELTPSRAAYTFLLDGEKDEDCVTYEQLNSRAQAIAVKLLSAGLSAGDRAVLVYPPGLDFITGFLGCLYAGIIAVPAYPPTDRTHIDRIPAIIADCSAAAVLTSAALAELAAAMLRKENIATQVIATDDAEEVAFEPSALEPSTIAFLQYTSGSTSEPKGVIVTHANIMANERMIQQAFEHDENSTVVGWLPLYHDMGLIGNVLQPLFIGAHAILMSPISFLERPVRWLKAISKYKAKTSGGPNFGYDLCCRKISLDQCHDLDLSNWTLAFNGAEPVRAETLIKFSEKFAPHGFRREAFYPCYGLAEATLFVSGGIKRQLAKTMAVDREALQQHYLAASTNEDGHHLVSCGKVWGDERICIVDPETCALRPNGHIGEIWIAGSHIAEGYWGRANETANTFVQHSPMDHEMRWLRTGDLGCLREGELFVTGRIKDVIKLNGQCLYAHDIAQVIEHADTSIRRGTTVVYESRGSASCGIAAIVEVVTSLEEPALGEIADRICDGIWSHFGCGCNRVTFVPLHTVHKTSSGKLKRHSTVQALMSSRLSYLLDLNYS